MANVAHRANADVVIQWKWPFDAGLLLAYLPIGTQYPEVDSPVLWAYYSDTFAPPGIEKRLRNQHTEKD